MLPIQLHVLPQCNLQHLCDQSRYVNPQDCLQQVNNYNARLRDNKAVIVHVAKHLFFRIPKGRTWLTDICIFSKTDCHTQFHVGVSSEANFVPTLHNCAFAISLIPNCNN